MEVSFESTSEQGSLRIGVAQRMMKQEEVNEYQSRVDLKSGLVEVLEENYKKWRRINRGWQCARYKAVGYVKVVPQYPRRKGLCFKPITFSVLHSNRLCSLAMRMVSHSETLQKGAHGLVIGCAK
ncbi:hypothetical protein LR48_Vigan11g126300 [Vigna angularis]|uniref:Uncharacterized protein n=1 Tax=Phaseolus angularis TaxID=3914 RepID=A0A0L9VTY4_PHAAN|nr:hypothetical protein LR48_Vigan11g126300 [Vigna angularis]